MLPPRIPKKSKRASRWRSPAHCNFVRSHQCVVPGCTNMPIEVMHIRVGSGAGISQKPDDFYTISGCRDHHAEQHFLGERTWEKRHGLDMMELAEAFSKASPKAKEIERIKRERGL